MCCDIAQLLLDVLTGGDNCETRAGRDVELRWRCAGDWRRWHRLCKDRAGAVVLNRAYRRSGSQGFRDT